MVSHQRESDAQPRIGEFIFDFVVSGLGGGGRQAAEAKGAVPAVLTG